MIGHTVETIYHNVVRLVLEDPALALFAPYCSWFPGKRELRIKDRIIKTLGARDEGAIGSIQGKTFSLCYCDEMTLYPESIIDMIDSRLSKKHSMGFASMNPSHPKHKMKQWIDKAEAGDPNYYSLHFTLEDNPYVDPDYKERIKHSMTGLAYKRNYLGLWCLAEGAIFDFFDTDIHVVSQPPRAAEYWIVGIDFGMVHPFACLLIGVSTGKYTQSGKCMWVEKEYFWDSKAKGRQKTASELADDVQEFLEPYAIRGIYMDPSAEVFHVELRKRGMHVIHANNDVENGINYMTSEMAKGNLFICSECKNTIRQIESFCWDTNAAKRGIDQPLKIEDDACVVGETEVLTKHGKFYIKDLVGKSGILYSYCIESNTLDEDRFDNVCKTRENVDIWQLTLANGQILKGTCDHRIYTKRGWVELQYLQSTDEVLTNYEFCTTIENFSN